MQNKRDISLDFVKIAATLLVLNSHMEICYPNHEYLATGGSIGDALFFFVSGFGLFLGKKIDFLNWYKRRLRRIFPAIIAIGLIVGVFFHIDQTFLEVMTSYRYWFIRAILVLYIFLYPLVVHPTKIGTALYISLFFLLVMYGCFFNYDRNGCFYGVDNYFRWIVFFPSMVLGGKICVLSPKIRCKWYALPGLLISILLFYTILYLWSNSNLLIISIVPLNMIPIFLYMLGKSSLVYKLFSVPILGRFLLLIGSLCLESYLIQSYIFTDKLNGIFPFNIPIIFLAVFVGSYILKILSNLLMQILDSKPLNLGEILKV